LIEYATLGAIIAVLSFIITLIGGLWKIFNYIGTIKDSQVKLKDKMTEELIQIAQENAEFRLTFQSTISDLSLYCERTFLKKGNG